MRYRGTEGPTIEVFAKNAAALLKNHHVADLELEPGDCTNYKFCISLKDNRLVVYYVQHDTVERINCNVPVDPDIVQRLCGSTWTCHLLADLLNGIIRELYDRQDDMFKLGTFYDWTKKVPVKRDKGESK